MFCIVYLFSLWAVIFTSNERVLGDEVQFRNNYDFIESVLMYDSSDDPVGYRIKGKLTIDYPLKDLLLVKADSLKLEIISKKSKGFVQHGSVLDSFNNNPFLIKFENGLVAGIFISKEEDPSLVDFKKGIASSLQLTNENLLRTEVDSSGECEVQYVKLDPKTLVKEKNHCSPRNVPVLKNRVWGQILTSERKTIANLEVDNSAVYINASENHVITAKLSGLGAVKVNSEIQLKSTGTKVQYKNQGTIDANEIISNLQKELGLEFTKHEFSSLTRTHISSENQKSFKDAVVQYKSDLGTKAMGTTRSADALLSVVDAVKHSSESDIYKILSTKSYKSLLPQLVDVLGAAQTKETHQAALKLLKLNTKDLNLDLCERYLWALSMSPNISPEIVEEFISLVKSKHPDEKLWQTIVLTLPAMVQRYTDKHGENEFTNQTISFLTESLNGCEPDDDQCKLIFLRGLANFPSDRALPTLLDTVNTSRNKVSAVALRVIHKLGPSKWGSEVITTALKVFLANATYDSSARTIALDIILESNPSDSMLHLVSSILRFHDSPRELKEYLLQRFSQESEENELLRERIKKIFLNQGLNQYNILAQGGLSTAFSRGFMDGGYLSTTQEVLGGLLKRGNVHIHLGYNDTEDTVFTLGLFSNGLGSVLSSDNEEEENEAASAGLELTVNGVNLRPFIFFNGHGELMGHVWSGTASSPTTAYQAILLLEDEVINLPMGIGHTAVIKYSVGASVDLSGQIEISLWNRNAQSTVQNKAGLVFRGSVDLSLPFSNTVLDYSLSLEPELHLSGYIQFSDTTAVCLQLQQPNAVIKYNTTKIHTIPGTKRKLRLSRVKTLPIVGKTYALNRKNNEMCSLILEEEEVQ